ncbi:unnamed protein product [Albugo candida]|uniref:Uncharacterized protein n=1 Tax=Albugo candida TaxID=65357 RepID=A0A024GU49_9STRA|nr:unnamed protein product [Albugo candida]|eukprot:CCI49883.1 unnamed protein product [Albugo candida]
MISTKLDGNCASITVSIALYGNEGVLILTLFAKLLHDVSSPSSAILHRRMLSIETSGLHKAANECFEYVS